MEAYLGLKAVLVYDLHFFNSITSNAPSCRYDNGSADEENRYQTQQYNVHS